MDISRMNTPRKSASIAPAGTSIVSPLGEVTEAPSPRQTTEPVTSAGNSILGVAALSRIAVLVSAAIISNAADPTAVTLP